MMSITVAAAQYMAAAADYMVLVPFAITSCPAMLYGLYAPTQIYVKFKCRIAAHLATLAPAPTVSHVGLIILVDMAPLVLYMSKLTKTGVPAAALASADKVHWLS